MFQNGSLRLGSMVRGGTCLIPLLGLSCLLILVLSGPTPNPKRRRRRGIEEGNGDQKGGGDLLEGSGGDLAAGGGLGEGSGEGRVGRRRGVKESRGTYFFCEFHLCHHHNSCHFNDF